MMQKIFFSVLQHENRVTETKTQIAVVKKVSGNLEVGHGAATAVTAALVYRRMMEHLRGQPTRLRLL